MEKNEIECLVCIDRMNNIRGVYMSDEDRDVGMHNMGMTRERYEKEGLHFVIGKLIVEL